MKARQLQHGKKRNTVSKQLTLIFVGLMAGVILACLLVNSLFIGKYYIFEKEKALKESYARIVYEQAKKDFDEQEFANTLNDLALRYNISMCVLDSERKVKYATSNGGDKLDVRLIGYVFGINAPSASVILDNDDYILQRTKEKNQEFLELYGILDNGVAFILQSTIDSIEESARLGIIFFAIIGVLGLVIGAIVIATITRKITRPLRELNDLSNRMVELDFDAKYQGKSNNEIGTLGENMNLMSASLEKTISELKTANVELQKDIEQKEQIDVMRKEFLANVSHELKTPIALIQGYAEGLQDNISDDPETISYYCDVIIDEAGKMNRLVKQLMSLNQLESGNDKVVMERFQLTSMLENCLEQQKLLATEKGCRVFFEKLPNCYVWGDEFKIEEVFTNYFTNATNHCSGEKRIEISMLYVDNKVRVVVFNTGEPIPEESLDLVWDKFYKVDKARTREYGGSGVGLSIVKAIMNSMNQNYGVDNREDGVAFWFELEKA